MNVTVDDLYMALGRILAENIALQRRIMELEASQNGKAESKIPADWGPTDKEKLA